MRSGLLMLGSRNWRTIVRQTGTLPGNLGWYLPTAGVILVLVQFPVNGGWLVAALGAHLLYAARRADRRWTVRPPAAGSG